MGHLPQWHNSPGVTQPPITVKSKIQCFTHVNQELIIRICPNYKGKLYLSVEAYLVMKNKDPF